MKFFQDGIGRYSGKFVRIFTAVIELLRYALDGGSFTSVIPRRKLRRSKGGTRIWDPGPKELRGISGNYCSGYGQG